MNRNKAQEEALRGKALVRTMVEQLHHDTTPAQPDETPISDWEVAAKKLAAELIVTREYLATAQLERDAANEDAISLMAKVADLETEEERTVNDYLTPTGSTLDMAAADNLYRFTPISWEPLQDLTYEQWSAAGATIVSFTGSINWWIGDWLNYGERNFGEDASQLYDILGWDYSKVSQVKWVASRVMSTTRVVNISWSHHREVAGMEPQQRAVWLEQAAANGWSMRQLRDEIKDDSEPDDVPFNHATRWDVPADERTPVDDYEQQPDEAPPTVYQTQPESWTTTFEWRPVPRSMQYDLITYAIKNGKLPDGYAICERHTKTQEAHYASV